MGGGLLTITLSACIISSGGDDRRPAQVTATGTTTTGGSGGQLGGSGGAGGATGGQGGGQGGGGSSAECLDSAEHEAAFAIDRDELCLVAKYDAAIDLGFFVSPTWGRHGGPLTASYAPAPADEATLSRWQLPSGATGTLTAQTTTVALSIAASTVYFGAQAIDLPMFDWTLVSWTGDFGSTDGEALLLASDAVAERHPVVGLFGAAGIATAADEGRLLHTSVTALGSAGASPVPALYAADFCAGPVGCGTGAVATWGEANGPVALDQDDNSFVMQTAFSTGDQTLRGFEASTIGAGTGATAGQELLTLPGYGSELAALSPDGSDSGLVFFQPFDGATYEALDIIAVPYTVSGTTVAPTTHGTALSMASANTPASLMTDDAGRLWVGLSSGAGQSTFYVLARRPPPR